MRWTMMTFYVLAGIAHFTLSEKFLLIVPDWVPFPHTVVLLTGICEIAGGIALASVRLRRLAGIMLALYAVCVFPANIKHAGDDLHRPGGPVNLWYHAPRLAFQPLLAWWAMFCAGLTHWPFRRPLSHSACGSRGLPGRRPRSRRRGPQPFVCS
jgi:uncharacterized membrane protein